MMAFAENLKAARKAAGLTQVQLAEKYNIPKRSIEEWERGGGREPPIYTQRLLLEAIERDA